MGTNYINFAADLWMYLLMMAVTTSLLGPFAVFIFALMMMAMPLLMAWLSTMVSIGFLTAYYIPFLPYTIFTFGSIAWLMAVVEAMVAAPIVALGVTHPEGEGPFGKAEQAIMILMNVFLRPSLMIIGYIAGIILSYVCVWVINAGFSNVIPFIQGPSKCATSSSTKGWVDSGNAADQGFRQGVTNATNWESTSNYIDCGVSVFDGVNFKLAGGESMVTGKPGSNEFNAQGVATGYVGWAGIYGFFFSILIYTSLYITVVQKSFTLISTLPDKVLRWIGGQPESAGGESAQWAEDTKKQVSDAGGKTDKAQGQMGKEMGGKAMQGFHTLSGQGTNAGASGKAPEATKSTPDGDSDDGGKKASDLGDVVESLPIE
jgi:defect-in-organelle-trafficking protein DotA